MEEEEKLSNTKEETQKPVDPSNRPNINHEENPDLSESNPTSRETTGETQEEKTVTAPQDLSDSLKQDEGKTNEPQKEKTNQTSQDSEDLTKEAEKNQKQD